MSNLLPMSDDTKPDTAPQRTYTVTIGEDKAGVRLDRALSDELADLSRARLQALLAEGRVCHALADGTPGAVVTEGKRKAVPGETFIVTVPAPAPARPKAQAIALDVVYEDDDLIVIDKPPGMVVHPAPGNPDKTLVNALLAHCGVSLSGIGGEVRPGIVHRLDKGTGGLLVAAKNDIAHRGLSAQFEDRSLSRTYVALVWGVPTPLEGDIKGQMGRSTRNRKKMAVVKQGGKYAETHYRVRESYGGRVALVECKLSTGRTHQIRVHMASIGHPVVGDPLYGGSDKTRARALPAGAEANIGALGHQALYAFSIGFLHPTTMQKVNFERPIPKYINALVNELEKI